MSPARYIALFIAALVFGAMFDAVVFVILYIKDFIGAVVRKFCSGIRGLNKKPCFFNAAPCRIDTKCSELLNAIRIIAETLTLIIVSYVVLDGEARIMFFAWSIIVGILMPSVASSSAYQRVVGVLLYGVRILLPLVLYVAYYPLLFIAGMTVFVKKRVTQLMAVVKKRQKSAKAIKKG